MGYELKFTLVGRPVGNFQFFHVFDPCLGPGDVYKRQLHNRGYKLVTAMPQHANIKGTLYSQRRKKQGILREPERSEDVCFDENCLKMCDGRSFLLADCAVGKERIMIRCV